MAEKLESIEKNMGTPQTKEEILILSDSNGKHFDPKRLHHEKTVSMEHTYTLEGAVKKIPERENPEMVKDIVFMAGLNDSKDHRTSVEEVVNRQKEACHKYHHRFRSARFHIVAVAPASQKQRNLNKRFRDYAASAGISFVNNDALLDEQTGDVQVGMLERFHYTPLATAILEKSLKQSLYGREPLQNIPRSDDFLSTRQAPAIQHQSTGPSYPVQSRRASSVYPAQARPMQAHQTGQAPPQSMNNPWLQQPHKPQQPYQSSASGVNELFNALGHFLQKWQTPPRPLF